MVLLLDRRAINGIIIITSPVGLHQEGEGDEARRDAQRAPLLPPSAPLPPNTFSWTDGCTADCDPPSLPHSLFPIAFFSDTLFHSGKKERLDNSKHDGEGAKGRGSRLVLPDYQ